VNIASRPEQYRRPHSELAPITRSTIQDIARSGFHHWYYRTATQQLVAGRHSVAREILIEESGGGHGGGRG
jgi:hypothetical protein